MSNDRFYVREHQGFASMSTGNHRAIPGIEVRVVDRDYCHRDIRTFPIPNRGSGHYSTVQWLERRRLAARTLCAELNRELVAP